MDTDLLFIASAEQNLNNCFLPTITEENASLRNADGLNDFAAQSTTKQYLFSAAVSIINTMNKNLFCSRKNPLHCNELSV